MAEIINLNRARKARQRAEEQQQAVENRIRFGRTRAEKQREALEKERAERDSDGKKLD